MVKAGQQHGTEAPEGDAFDYARLPDFSEILSMNPFFAQPAAAMAAASAIGFGIANQMAGAFFGALQGAMQAANDAQSASVVPEQKSYAEEGAAAAGSRKKQAPEEVAGVSGELARTALKVEPPKARSTPTKPTPTKPARAKPAAAPKVKAEPAGENIGSAVAVVVDDLKLISGIGPKVETVLKGMGVTRFAEIAAWNKADVARFEKELGFDGRILRDDWVGQAKALVKTGVPAAPAASPKAVTARTPRASKKTGAAANAAGTEK
ncbi:MAG: 5' DNA nuclease [Neorhizobium sp.]|nr:5' DNA nuclease [Neorhizobium sp.]